VISGVDESVRTPTLREALLRALVLSALLMAGCASGDRQGGGAIQGTRPDEEQLTQKIKAEILRDLREGNWLAEQMQLAIERYVQRMRAANDAALAEQARQAQEKARQVRRVTPTRDHVRGNRDGELSLIEYSDFECPFCKQFHETARQVVEMSAGKINWVYRHFPLGFHNPGAQKEAEAAECAYEAGGDAAFWAYADAIYARTTSNGQGFPPDRLVPLAQELGHDRQAFQACLDSGRPAARVREDIAEGEHVGVSATPTNILLHNKTGAVRVIVGAVPLTEVRAGVAQLLAESGQPPSVAVPGETWLPR